MQFGVGRQDRHAGLGVAVVLDSGDAPAGLCDEQHARRHVPRLQIALVIGVVTARRDPGEVQGGGTQAADARHALAHGVDVLDGLGVARLADEGQAGGDQAFGQVTTAGDADALVVQIAALAVENFLR